jgi:DNA invertase Pin-like site-specific DNA recombinase
LALRAALYCRVSTEDQAKEGFSIAAQQKRLNAYCKARGWTVASEYIDEGHSGRTSERPAYKRMMAEKEQWDVLLVLKMDRIHRNSKNFAIMMDQLRDWEKEFNSMTESFDTTTAIGRFVMDIIQRIAQLESEQIGERVKVGMSQKAKKNKGPLGFPAPYGYTYENGMLEVEREEARNVLRIFEMNEAAWTLSSIADWLNQNSIKGKNGALWQKATVRGVLTNPMYKGDLIWDGIKQNWPQAAILSPERFDEAQSMMAARRRSMGKPKKKRRIQHA